MSGLDPVDELSISLIKHEYIQEAASITAHLLRWNSFAVYAYGGDCWTGILRGGWPVG